VRRARRQTQGTNVSVPAPVLGLVESSPVAAPDPRGAEVLRNFLPTQRGIKVRAGHSRAAFVTDPVITLHTYNQPTGSGMFAATADAIYDITAQNPTTAHRGGGRQLPCDGQRR